MKIIQKLSSILFILVLICSCKPVDETIKIGFLMPASDGTRWTIDKKYVTEASEKQGVELFIRSAENNENVQIKQATELLKLGVDALIVVPVNSNTAAAIVRDAHNNKVPVIAYDRLIKNANLDYLVTFDGKKIAELMTDHAIEKVPQGNYVLLWGDPNDLNAVTIKEAQEKALAPYVEDGSITIVYKGFTNNWSMENAYHNMSKVLSYSGEKIDAVITSYDGLALGAVKALNEFPGQNVKVITGQDANIDAIKSIIKDEMTLTIYKSIKSIAEQSVSLAHKLASNQKIGEILDFTDNGKINVPTIYLEPIMVNKNNIQETVIADHFYAEEELYGN